MRSLILIGSMTAMAAILVGCSAGAQESERRTAERSFPVGAFHSVSLGGSESVIVTVGGAPSVRAEGDADLLERLEIAVEDGELRIAQRGRSWSLGFSRHRPVTVHVTVPALVGAAVGGSGDMRIDRVEGQRFVASVGGSGDIQIDRMQVAEAIFSVGGSGDIRAAGAAQRSEIHLAGSGGIDLDRLQTEDATVSLAGSGDIVARATGTARVSLVGSGDVVVNGTARCEVSKRGSGDVRCGA
jgi:hypothetical protein